MKRRKNFVKGAALGAALTGITLGFGGCAKMQPQDVYGPPPDVQEDAEAPSDFSPEEMAPETVYGPPGDEYNETVIDETESEDAGAAASAGEASTGE